MHEIHSVTCLGYALHHAISPAGSLDAPEEEEGAGTHDAGKYGVVLQVHLQFCRSIHHEASLVESPYLEGITCEKYRDTYAESLSGRPIDMFLDVMPEDNVSYKSGYIIEERIRIPPAFSEYRAEEVPEQIQTEGECPKYQEEFLFLFAGHTAVNSKRF